MSMTKRFTAFVLALIMMLGCVNVIGSAEDSYNAGIDIKMGKIIDGAWTEVQEVNPGDEVLARVTLTTDFPCGMGNFMFFYDSDFYEDEYQSPDDLSTINPAYKGTGYNFSATIVTECGGNARVHNKVTNIIGAENQAKYNWVYIAMDSLGYYNEVFDGSKYLFDIELKVKSDASGKGYFTVLPEIISSPDNESQFFNLSIGDPGELAGQNTEDMYNNYVNFTITPDAEGDYTEIAESENTLVITTKFFREEDGQWIETSKAKRGETLKARVYLDSAYPTSSGELMFFYDNTFFSNGYSANANDLTVNAASGSFAAQNAVEGWFYTPESSGAQAKVAKMVSEGYIAQADVDANDYFYIIYEFGEGKTNTPAFDDDVEGADAVVDNDLWFCEFELTVADDATDEGDIVVNPDTIATENSPFGAVNVPKGYENSYNAFGMWLWDADVQLYSNPVSLESTVTFDANGGTIDSEPSKEITGYIGETYTVPTAVKDGSTFAGWYVEGDATETTVDPVTEIPYEDITYVAKWTDNVTVTFKDSDDDTITYDEKTGAVGSEFPEIANPTKEGYGFAAWSLSPNGAPATLPSVYPDDDAVYYAVWEENTYPVTYVIKNEVTGSTVNRERSVAFGSVIPTDNIYETPEGYVFDGWYKDADYNEEFVAGTTMPASAQTLYAKLTADTYTVTFVLDGGKIGDDEGPIDVETPYMGTIAAPGTPVKEHNTFMGWSPDLQQGAVLDEPANRTYTATWESEPYTITYYKSEDDKTAGTAYETGEYKPGESVDSVADPHIEGQTFTGWKYYDETGAEINFTGTMPENDVVAVAQYTPIVYTLTINYVDENGDPVNTGTTANPYVDDDLAYGDTYSVASPAVEGYELVDAAQQVISGTVELEEPETEITVNVVYKPSEYTITWILDGGKIGEDEGPVEQTYAYGANVTAPADPEKEGYTFTGWLPDVIPATMPAENLEFTAQWTANEYNVTFKLEGGKYNDSTDDVVVPTAFDSAIAALDPAPEKDGYTFQGWSNEAEGSVLTDLGTMDDVNGKTFYAVWLADNAPYYIDIYYMGTDGNYPDATSETKAGDADAHTDDHVSTDPSIGAKEGFTFDDAAANVLEGDIPATGELRLKVYYKRDRHNVKFYVDGAAVADDDLYYEEAITAPDPAPEKEGYTFKGWSDTDGGTTPVTVASNMGTEDLEYYAIFEINTHTLTINYIDEAGTPVAAAYTEDLDYGTDYSQSSPAVTGYSLVDSAQATVAGTMPDADVTVEVIYKLNVWSLTINYVDEDGNEVATAYTQQVEYNKDYSQASPEVTGYHLVDEGQATVAGSMPDSNLEVNVVYAPNPHTATWLLNGGNIGGDTNDVVQNYVFGDTIVAPETPVKDGYTFSGWTPGVAATMDDQDQRYTAQWTANEYNVTFKLEGGKYNDSTDDVVVPTAFDSAIAALDPAPEKDGYTFKGWAEEAEGSVIADLGTMDDVNGKTFYAIWGAEEYTLTVNYVMADGKDDLAPATHTEQVAFDSTYSVPSPAVEGYTPDIATVEGTMDDVNGKTVTVTYTPDEYTLTVNYVMADGKDDLAPATHTEQVAYNADYSVASPAVEGYTPDIATVEGTMDDVNGKTATVTYNPNPYMLTIHYVYAEDNSEAAPDYVGEVSYNAPYSVASPSITGYTPDVATVEGTMDDVNGKEITVKYSAGEYTLTVNYVMADGSEAPEAHTEQVAFGGDYSVTSPSVTGYTPDVATVTGTMDDINGKTETVTYTPNAHTVTWKPDGGKWGDSTDDKVDNVVFGDTIVKPEDPVKDGYTFTGWAPDVASTVADEDYVYTAQWTPNEYNATFKLEGGKYNDSTADVAVPVTFGSAITALDPAPTRDGYTFQGWSNAAEGSVLTDLGTMDDVNGKTFYAVWLADNAPYYIDIYYMGTDGNYPDAASETKAGDADAHTDDHVSTDSAIGAKEGFTFDDAAANVLEGDIPATGELRLKVYYKRDKHTVKFMDGSTELDSQELFFEQEITEPAKPTKEGYTCTGWTDAPEGTTLVDVAEKMGTDDITYYAFWSKNTYDVIYKFDDAISSANTNTTPADVEDTYTFEDVEFEAAVPEINNPVSKESGYSFIDWVWYSLDGSEEAHGRTAPNTEEPGDTITYDGRTGTKIAKPATVPASDVIAVAYFKAPGTAEFYYGKDEAGADDATRLYEKNTGENDTAISAPATDPTIEGYTFAGWFERDEATGQPTGSEVTDFGKYVSGETKKFVAKWEEIPAYANFYANEGAWSTGEEPLKLTGVHAAPITAPTDSDGTLSRAGYTFVGWGDSADATAPVAGLGNYDRNSDANFYAIWEKNQATFDANGGKIDVDGEPKDEVTITEYDEGDDISGQVKDPTWPGHTFEGWFDSDGNEVDPENMPGGDIGVVTAKWSENGKKNINYYDDEGNLIKAVPVPEGAETPELGKDTEGNDIPKDKPGKTFAGWVDADGNPVTLPANMPGEDINVYAKYDVVDYTLSFDPNGGDWGNGDTAVKSETKHYGDAVSKPADPAAPDENHYFAGWSLDGTNVVDVASTMPANNLAYKAVWREIEGDKYTVTYKDSDGTTIETLEAAEGDTVPKPTTKPSKPGYAFTGWKWTDASGKEIDTPVLMPGENIVATATYAPIRKGGSVIVVGTASARDGSAIGEYSGEYGGEYAAPSYSTPEGTVFRPQPTESAQDYGEAIPQTGSNETAALFALVSAAAAAAYVVFAAKSKKKDDED